MAAVPKAVKEGALSIGVGFQVKKRWIRKLKPVYDRIIGKKGNVTPEDLVDAARPKRSPIHGMFEWDDTVAAEKYRLEQAGYFIRSLRISLTITGGGVTVVRPLISVVSNGKKTYVPTVKALDDQEYRAQIIAQALRELTSFQAKYAALKELGDIFAAIERLRTSMKA